MSSNKLFSKTGNSIYNDEIRKFLEENIKEQFSSSNYSDMVNQEAYIESFRGWIKKSKENKILGLDSFSEADVSLGVTQAIDVFHYEILNKNKKLRIFRGEYPYNRDVHPFSWDSDFLDDRDLEKGDAVIISCPFSGHGSSHKLMERTFDKALELNVPVFVDMAWFGTCAKIEIDLSHPGITYVGFSLTKSLTCGNYRSGVRFSRNKQEGKAPFDRLSLQNEWNHGIHLNTRIGLMLMNEFGPDYHYLKYSQLQKKICEKNKLIPSNCVHIATAENGWEDYKRDHLYRRINIREAVKQELRKK